MTGSMAIQREERKRKCEREENEGATQMSIIKSETLSPQHSELWDNFEKNFKVPSSQFRRGERNRSTKYVGEKR